MNKLHKISSSEKVLIEKQILEYQADIDELSQFIEVNQISQDQEEERLERESQDLLSIN